MAGINFELRLNYKEKKFKFVKNGGKKISILKKRTKKLFNEEKMEGRNFALRLNCKENFEFRIIGGKKFSTLKKILTKLFN